MKNPKWHRDEIILALDLYFDPYLRSIDSTNPKIIELSEILNRLPIFTDRPDAEKFRNPNGVSLKLSNFLAIDPNHSGKGMASYSKLDKQIFDEFAGRRRELRQIANQIKGVVRNTALTKDLDRIHDDETATLDSVQEGQVLYKLHKYRERDSKITRKKKEDELKRKGKLICEICNFDFNNTYGEVGYGFIECHHKSPLANNDGIVETKIDDLALVCSNCHRMLHRKINLYSFEDFRKLYHGMKNNS